jgi:steroid delta-isomerase-like uncharacterized protein
MSTEETKVTVHRILEEVWNEGRLDAVDRYLATDVTGGQASTEREYSPEAIKEFVAAFRSAFPDVHVTIEDVVAEGDKVAFRATWRGTYQGGLRNISNISHTGESIVITGIGILRLADGKIAESSINTSVDQDRVPEMVQRPPQIAGDSGPIEVRPQSSWRGLRWPPRWK